MTQPSESPVHGGLEQDPSSPIKPLALYFAMTSPGSSSPESKEIEKKRWNRNNFHESTVLSPSGQETLSLLTSPSGSADSLAVLSPKAMTKMKISPSPPSQPPGASISSPSSPIYPTVPLFPSHSSPTSPALAPLTLVGRVSSMTSLEFQPPTGPKPKPGLTIVTGDDFQSHHIASLIGDDVLAPDTAPAFMFGPSAPPSPRNNNLPPRPKSTTAADCLRTKFNFPEQEEEEQTIDDEFVNRRSQLTRSQSVSGRMEPDSGTPLGDLDAPLGGGLLPSIDANGSCGIKRVSIDTCAALLRGDYRQTIDRYLVADCRYDYEYLGGHIRDAFNTNSKQTVENLFEHHREGSSKVVVVFHCEFSKHRGPNCCRHFRQFDRESNTYPHLTFPELYVMEGGYRLFFQKFPDLCVPATYVSMWDPKYSKECKERHKEFKKSWATNKSKRGGRRNEGLSRGGPTGNSSRRSLSRGRRLEAIEDSGSPDAQAGRDKGDFGVYGRYQKPRKAETDRHVSQPSSSPSTAFPTPSVSPRSIQVDRGPDKENKYFDSNLPSDHQTSSISPSFASLRLRSKSSPAGHHVFGFSKAPPLPTDMEQDTFSLSEPMQVETLEESPSKGEYSGVTRLRETSVSYMSGSTGMGFLSRGRH